MKKVITFIALLACLSAQAQDRKVAVFNPAGSVSNSIKEIIREEISSVTVNAGGYTVLERQMINKVLEENRFQASGLVDDTQVVEMGRLIGANLALVTTVTPLSGNYYISCKLIDVQTGRIERQNTTQTQYGTNDLTDAVRKSAGIMLSATATIAATARVAATSTVTVRSTEKTPEIKPINNLPVTMLRNDALIQQIFKLIQQIFRHIPPKQKRKARN